MRMVIMAAAGLLASAGGAMSQDWGPYGEEQGVVGAVARWPSGAILFARCDNGRLDLLAPLAAPVEGEFALAEYSFNDGDTTVESWSASADGRTVFARNPARFARTLMSASSLSLRVTGDNAPSQRFELNLSSDTASLASTLNACGHTLTDSRDALPLISAPQWASRPNASIIRRLYPLEAAAAQTTGVAHVACVARWDGTLEDCRLLSETPPDMGFGEATLRAARHHRLEAAPQHGADPRRGMVHLSIRWELG